MTSRVRLTGAAQDDIVAILARSQEVFGESARLRYEALLSAAIRDAADPRDPRGPTPRPELGDGMTSWPLARSRQRTGTASVVRPRHVLYCRREGEVLVIARVLHESMDPLLHLGPQG